MAISVDVKPVFTVTAWDVPSSPNAGLSDKPCWPENTAPNDPGFVFMTNDDYYGGKDPPYDYRQKPRGKQSFSASKSASGTGKSKRALPTGIDAGDLASMVNRTFVA